MNASVLNFFFALTCFVVFVGVCARIGMDYRRPYEIKEQGPLLV
jgi:hypothetical protein